MDSARSPWRALRPLLLAGAAAATWLTLSAPAASADAATDPGSLLGGVSSSVSSVSETAINPVGDVLAAAVPAVSAEFSVQPSSADPDGLLQPLTGAATGTVDHLVEAVPVVNQIVPSGTVGTVTAPVTAAADGIASGIAEEVLPVASSALPLPEPVVEPVSDLLSSIDSLPGTDVSAPDLAFPDVSAVHGTTASGAVPPLVLPVQADAENSGDLPAASVMPMSAAHFPAYGLDPLPPAPVQAGILEAPLPNEGTPHPAALPAVPGSGSASSQSQGGGAGSTAWLSTFAMNVPLTGVLPVGGALQSPPSPVSFDPGSSPD
ncbi:hypothetical protein TV39_05100 [Arthrobacter sp. SPG23]|nr:hypothetical protein TV39_05100 [Arthrobacter sp. SPG23]